VLNISNPEIKLVTSALVIANVHYFLRKHTNKSIAKVLVKEITKLFGILSFEEEHILLAVDSDHADLEDSFQYYIALQNNCDTIITRNIKDYKHATIPVVTAEQFLRTIL